MGAWYFFLYLPKKVLVRFEVSPLRWFTSRSLMLPSTFLIGISISAMSKWKELTFSFRCEFSCMIWWLLSNKLMTFSDKLWFKTMSCSTCCCSSSICFFFRIRDLLADSRLETTLLALLSSGSRPSLWQKGSPFGSKWSERLLLLRVDKSGDMDCKWTWKLGFCRNVELKLSFCGGIPSRMSKQWWERWGLDSMLGFRCLIIKMEERERERERERDKD